MDPRRRLALGLLLAGSCLAPAACAHRRPVYYPHGDGIPPRPSTAVSVRAPFVNIDVQAPTKRHDGHDDDD